MSQNDFTIANQTFPNTRADINSALQALASTSSGSSAPSTTFANQLWYDTSANILYIRNEDNDGNIPIAELDQSNDTVEYFKSDSVRTALIEFTDGDDALTIADGGALTTAGNLSIGGSNNELRFYEGANYVGFEAPALSADKIWVLPNADGSANQGIVTDGSGNLSFADVGGDSLRPNAQPMIINGDMKVAQRATSVTGKSSDGYYTVDRMKQKLNDAGTYTISQSTDVPSGYGFTKSLKYDVTTAKDSPSAGTLGSLDYHVEAQDLKLLRYGTSNAKKITFSFWVKSPKTGTHILSITAPDGNRHIAKAYTVSSANTWENHIVNFDGDTSGTINDDNGSGFQLQWLLVAGSNYTSGTLATSWASYTASNAYVGQVNVADSTSNNFFITGIQMEVGEYTSSTIPSFQHESFADSLLRCKRYYQQSYTYGVVAGSVATDGAYMIYIPTTGNTFRYNLNFETAMRAVPTKVFYNPATGTVGKAGYEGSGDTNAFTVNNTFNTNKHALIFNTGVPAVGNIYWHWTATSEL
tara:strand:- start:72 stop:1655 length:1584 start_codon:yes stop_codon:yes gene_type:complete